METAGHSSWNKLSEKDVGGKQAQALNPLLKFQSSRQPDMFPHGYSEEK